VLFKKKSEAMALLHAGDLKLDGQRAVAAVTKRRCGSVEGYAGMLCEEETTVLQHYAKKSKKDASSDSDSDAKSGDSDSDSRYSTASRPEGLLAADDIAFRQDEARDMADLGLQTLSQNSWMDTLSVANEKIYDKWREERFAKKFAAVQAKEGHKETFFEEVMWGASQPDMVLVPRHCSTTADGSRVCEERKLQRFWLPSLK